MRKEDIKNFHGPGNASIRIKGLMLICRFPRVLLRPEKKESGVLQTYVLRIATISDFLDFFFYLRITYCYDFRFLCLSLSLTYYVLLVLLRFPISLPFFFTYVLRIARIATISDFFAFLFHLRYYPLSHTN